VVRLRVEGGAYRRLVISIPRDRLAAWSLTPALPALSAGDDAYRVRIIPGHGRAWEASFELRGSEPVDVQLSAVHEPAPAGAAARQVEARLPRWVVTASRLDRASVVRL
jgi:hypothetical protein